MGRFILFDCYSEKGKWFVVIYDNEKHFCYVESLIKFRQKLSFYHKHGLQKGENYGKDEEGLS